jgi:hypothetical protein
MEQNKQGQFVPSYKGGRLDTWARGMDNRRSNSDIPADMVRMAVNVDALLSGRMRRRRGISQVVADANAHSVFGGENRLYWATPTTLKSCDINFDNPITHLTSPLLANPISFFEHQGAVYFSNEQINGKIVGTTYQPWGIVPPSVAPVSSGITSTITDPMSPFFPSITPARQKQIARNYALTCTFVIKQNGIEIEESGAPAGLLGISDDSGYLSFNVPQPTDARVTHTRIYVADMNGTAYFQALEVPVGQTTATLNHPYTLGKQLTTQFLMNPPPGQFIVYRHGRFFIAAGNILYFTEPLRYGGVHAVHGFFMYPERITMLIAVDDGIYLSSDQTYFLSGTPEKGKITQDHVFPYRAIEGAATNFPDSNDAVWRSERGIVIGHSGGKAENVTESQIALDTVQRATIGFIETNGARRIVTIAKDSSPSPLQNKDYTDAEATWGDERQ